MNKNSKITFKLIISVFLFIILLANVKADTIFSDDFESSNLGGWTLTNLAGANNWTASSTDPFAGTFHAQSQPQSTSEPASVLERTVSTSGYQNINVNYKRKLVGIDIADEFQMEWFDGSSWTILEQTGSSPANDANYVNQAFDLGSNANNNPNFKIKFECTAGAVSEFCRVDNVIISGDLIDTTPPLITVNSPQANQFINISSLTINISLNENGSVRYSLNNGINNFTISGDQGLFGTAFNITNNSIADGAYTLRIFANDTTGNVNNTVTRTFTIDTTLPIITTIQPQNISYNTIQTQLNYSVSDINLQICWYSLNDGQTNTSITCGQNVTGLSSDQSSNTWKVYANDSAGNTNSSSVTFFVDSISPSLSISKPSEGSTFGTNTSLELNFSVSDTYLQSCWYHIDSSSNITIPNCVNTTFNTSSGSHTLYLYANDTLNNKASANVNFTISIGAPSITQLYPINTYSTSAQIIFNYTATDVDLNACQLWGDFNGTYAKNQTNSTLISGQQSSFSLTLSDNTYKWAILCNDTLGNSVITSNKTFYVDTIFPTLSITQPSGTKTSRNNIPITFTASDTNLQSCWYNVYRGITQEISNTTISCASSAETFNVTVDASFTLNLYANDSAANTNSSSSTFTVDTSSPPPSGGGGSSSSSGGGGGGSLIAPARTNSTRDLKIDIVNPTNLAVKRGTGTNLELEIINNERIFINDCRLEIKPPFNEWFTNNQIKGLSSGEKFKFDINIKIPEDTEPKEYFPEIIIKCDEGHKSLALNLVVFRNTFEVKITNYEKTVDALKITYYAEEFAQEDHDIIIEYELINFEGESVVKGQEKIGITPGYKGENSLEFKLPKDIVGEYELKMKLTDGITTAEINKKLVLPSKSVLGLAISENNRRTLSIFGIIIVFLIIAFFIVQFLYKKYQNLKIKKFTQKLEEKHGKKVIKLDLRDK